MSHELLIAGCEAGHYKLPAALLEAAAAVDSLQAALDEQPFGPELLAEARLQFETATVEAARAGKPLPSAAELIKTRVAAETQGEVHAVLTEAARMAEHHLRFWLGNNSLVILTDFLRPALTDTISKATAAVKPMEGVVLDRESIASAAEPARAAWRKLESLSERYSAIRAARSVLRLPPPLRDDLGHFSEFRNAGELWPERAAAYRDRARASIMRTVDEIKERSEAKPVASVGPPWPAAQPAKLVWIVQNGAQAWLPLAAEQDLAYEADQKRASALLYQDRSEWQQKNWVTS